MGGQHHGERYEHQHGHEHDFHGHDDEWDDGDDFDFDFSITDTFKFDLSDFSLKSLGKITDYEISHKHLSITLGNTWTFSLDGSAIDFGLKHSGLPVVYGGTIDAFEVDGPGKADFSISGLDMSAKTFYNALRHLDGDRLLNLLLSDDETISGSGFGDHLFGLKGNDTIYGNNGSDQLEGGKGDDMLAGGKGNDYLLGGKHDDILIGGEGSDYLLGGDDADTFTFAPGSGTDIVGDFNANEDVIDLSAFGFAGSVEDFLSEHARMSGSRCHDEGDLVIDFGNGDKIKLEDVSGWDLNDSNLLL